MAPRNRRLPGLLLLAFFAGILVPSGTVLYFGARAISMESRFARTSREERLRRMADLLVRRVERETADLAKRVDPALWPFREPAWDAEAAESGALEVVRRERWIRSAVLFSSDARVLGPALTLPFLEKETPDAPGSLMWSEDLTAVDPVEMTEARFLANLAQRRMIREALLEEEQNGDTLKALAKLQEAAREGGPEGALALYHTARLRLALGHARQAAAVTEDFITRNLAGPPLEKGVPLRVRMFFLWAEAWEREGAPGRSLEILFWFWDELLKGSFPLDLEGFSRLEEEAALRVERLLTEAPGDEERWKERLSRFRALGRAAMEAGLERILLATEVVPRLASESGTDPGLRTRALLLRDRLEVFLYLPPVRFELGLEGDRGVGVGFRVDTEVVHDRLLAPLAEDLTSDETSVRVLDPSDATPRTLEAEGIVWPLPEPFQGWRVAVLPGRTDPEGRLARSRMWFHGILVCCAVLGLTGAVSLMIRSFRRATELAVLRSEFVSNVTHDLKTPITSIRMFVETLAMGRVKDPARIVEYYRFMENEVERLERLIDNILEFARIEAGRRPYSLERLDLGALTSECVERFRPSAELAGFTVELAVGASPPVLGDADALCRALTNLLSNAVKFALETKWIGVRVDDRGTEAVVEVADRGIGIPAGEREKIFEKYFRGESGKGGGRAGTGLGLALVQHVVRGHNGRVEVRSREGEGTTFSLAFPVAPPADGASGAAAGTQQAP